MRALHGTPDEFWAACRAAQWDGFVTVPEALAAVQKYGRVYFAAPEK